MILNQIGESANRRVFTGKEEDVNTGLVYFGQRYYDPDTARFINQDSYLGEAGTPPSLHRYLYAYSNPTVYIDLEGYESEEAQKGFLDKLQEKKNDLVEWVGENVTKPFYDFTQRTHESIARKNSVDGSDDLVVSQRQHDREIRKDAKKQAEEIAKPMVDAAEAAVGNAAVKGIGIVAGVRKTKAVVTIEDASGKIAKKVRDIEKEAKGFLDKLKSGFTKKSAEASRKGVGNSKVKNRAEIGQEAHRQLEAEGASEWIREQRVELPDGRLLRKDGVSLTDSNKVRIIKPDTISGIKSANKRSDLMQQHGYDTHIDLYDPTDSRFQPGSPTYIGPKNRR